MKIKFTFAVGGAIALLFFFNSQSFAQSGNNCSNAIPVAASNTCTLTSYSTTDSVRWFSFTATSPYMQIVEVSPTFGISGPHIHEMTLYGGTCSSLQMVEDEIFADVHGANEIVIDASGLTVGNTYYVKASRITRGVCVPLPGTSCGGAASITFSLCIRSLNVIIPKDFGLELPAISHAYYTGKGQITDVNHSPRNDIKCYTNNASPAIYIRDTAVSFVLAHIDTFVATPDTLHRVDMTLAGSNTNVRGFKTEKIGGYLNYFLAHVPDGAVNIKGYNRDVINDVYQNIDMQFYSNNVGAKFYFIVRPGGNADNIVLNFAGAASVKVTASGGLDINTSLGKINFEAPHAYQVNPSGNIVPMPWQAKFIKLSPTQVKFDIRNYPANMPLFIQVDRGHLPPTPQSTSLVWSTYYGGNGWDAFRDVVTDAVGNIYTTGPSGSSNFPNISGGFQTNLSGGDDAVAVKFANTGTPIWATYYGGTGTEFAYGIGVDASQNVYFTGYTFSTNFPTLNAVQPKLNGTGAGPDADVFIVSLDPTGTLQNWATYYGGNNASSTGNTGEVGYALAVDGLGDVYVVGGYKTYMTTPTPLPLHTLAGSGVLNSNVGTGFILKFSTAGAILWATDIGGAGTTSSPSATTLNSCAVDNANFFYVVGRATENGYPIVNPGASASFNTDPANTFDVVATKFSTGGSIVWSTYYGNKGDEEANALRVDKNRNAYITGYTKSPTSDPIQLVNPGWPAYFHSTCEQCAQGWKNAFIARFDPTGKQLWGTYFKLNGSPNGDVEGTSIAIDDNNEVFIVGYASGNNVPLPSPNAPNTYVQNTNKGAKDIFVATFYNYVYNKWGTYFGGTNDEDVGYYLPSAATYKSNFLYVAGLTQSYDFPTANAYQSTMASAPDAFLSEFDLAPVLISSVDENNISDDGIMVFPNPASENITVNIEQKEKENVEITLNNLLGENLYSETLKNQSGTTQKQISLSDLPTGVYILKIKAGDKIVGKKIIKRY